MEFVKTLWTRIYLPVCIFIPCIIYQVFMYKSHRWNKGRTWHLIWSHIFILYLYMALDAAGGGGLWDIGYYDSVIRVEEINLIPFQSEGAMTYILNIIMFMPLGFLLPLLWEQYEKIARVIAAGAGFSFLIEVGQLFNRRKTDIDDLLMNVIGTILGFIICYVFHKIFRTKRKEQDNTSLAEPIAYIILAVLGKFFLYNWRFFVRIFYL